MSKEINTGIPKNEMESTPISLADIALGKGGSIKTPIDAFLSSNLGNRTLIAALPLAEFFKLSLVANDRATMSAGEIAQRPLDANHAKKLATYILKGLVSSAIDIEKSKGISYPAVWEKVLSELGSQAYESLQPIVVNIRECKPDASDLQAQKNGGCWTVHLEQTHKLWVVDGQHRRKGMEMMFEFLNEVRSRYVYPKRGVGSLYTPSWANPATSAVTGEEFSLWETCFSLAHQNATIAVEIHLGLNVEQERQLFHDLNRLGKKIDVNLALDYDTSNPINNFAKEFLIDEMSLKVADAEPKDWGDDKGEITRKDLTSINARLFLNKTNINGATAENVNVGQQVAKQFWQAVGEIPDFGQEKARQKTVAAQPVVLKALAKLAYDFALSKRKPDNGDELYGKLIAGMNQTGEKKIDFSHSNPMWQYYQLSPAERVAKGLAGLEEYLPSEETGNRDIGGYQDPYFRFGSKHNDIFPIIGDMVRWQLGLPSRNKKD